MKTSFHSRAACLAACLFCAGSAAVQATTINWGTYLNSTSYLFDSSGLALDDGYVFELGTFGTFIPTEANMSDWLANWKVFDRATAPVGNGFDSGSGTVAHAATFETDFTTSNTSLSQAVTFAEGEQAYIWIYEDAVGNPQLTPGYEWALITNDSTDGTTSDDWLMPAPSGHVATSIDWRIEDATASPFGGLNDTQGPGDYTSTPGTFVLQTHTTVPEPGSALLIALTGFVQLLRTRRRRR